MEFGKTALLLFGAIGVVNGFFFSNLLLLSKNRNLKHRLLGWLILVICIRIGKSIYAYYAPEPDRLILQIGLSACIFIGPLAYLYFKESVYKRNTLSLIDKWLLAAIIIAILGIGLRYPYNTFPEIWNGWLIRGIYFIWMIFLALSATVLTPSLRRFLVLRKASKEDRRLVVLFTAFLFITATYQFALWIQGFTYLWGSLIFTSVFYYLMYKEVSGLIRKQGRKRRNRFAELPDGDQILEQINQLITQKKLYKNPALKLPDLEKASGIKVHILSRVLNEVYEHGFATFINEKRVEEAKQMIRSKPQLTLEGIGYESGFNSKSSFYATFKRLSGYTPAEYKNRTAALK